MGDWKPIRTWHGGVPSSAPVRIAYSRASGHAMLVLAGAVLERMGDPEYVAPMLNGSPSLVGFRAATCAARGETLKVSKLSQGTRRFGVSSGKMSINGVLGVVGKARTAATHLPHHWDGEVLVIDLSGLPDAPGDR
jgi:hypothetical protein